MTVAASVIIPAFERIGPLRETLASAHAALAALAEPSEVIIVDDGSSVALETLDLPWPREPRITQRIIRQANSGSIIARQTGLTESQGTFVQFLDSDDLIAPNKIRLQINAMQQSGANASFGTLTNAIRDPAGDLVFPEPEPSPSCTRPLNEWLLLAQPVPHLPLYRSLALKPLMTKPLVQPDRRMDPAGDTWFYLNCALMSGHAVHVPAALAAIGIHEEIRFSQHWEKLGFASLLATEAFERATRGLQAADRARQLVAIGALRSWRRLPVDFNAAYQDRLWRIWNSASDVDPMEIDGNRFGRAARFLGASRLARLIRTIRNHRYESVRTLDETALNALIQLSQPLPDSK